MSLSPTDRPFELDRLDQAAEFQKEWDVASFGEEASNALIREVDIVRTSPSPHGGRKIHVLLGPSGYGKTHLFGRVLHVQKDRVQFVYVPITSDPARVKPADQVRWEVVETLFHPLSGVAPLRAHLARLLAPSFAAFFDQLPEPLRGRCRPLSQRLASEPAAVFEVLGPVSDIPPFHALADSVRKQLPDLSAGAIRALVLSLSSAVEDARTWLRGEEDAFTQERRHELRLGDAPPDTTALLQTVATLLQKINTPLLLCLDQIEWLMQNDEIAFRDLTAALMSWLQQVPNLVLVLGCMTDAWDRVAQATFVSFRHRARVWKLDQLSPEQASEMVVRRMRTWTERTPQDPVGWPFDLPSLQKFVAKMPAGPRGLLQLCASRFDEWLAEGRNDSILLDGVDPPLRIEEAFLKEWTTRLQAARQTLKAAVHYQEADLWDAVAEVVGIAREAQLVPEGMRIEKITLQALRKSNSDARPSAQIDLLVGDQRFAVVLAVSKKDGGVAFGAWVDALEDALGEPVVGAVVVWPRAQLSVGRNAQAFKKYSQWVTAGTMRAFPLDENEEAFHQLETFRVLLKDAETGNLLLNNVAIKADQCRQLAVQTRIFANLKLFEMLFHNWPAIEKVRADRPRAPGSPPGAPPGPQTAPTRPATPIAAPPAAPKPKAMPMPVSAATPSPAPVSATSPPAGAAWAQDMLERVAQKLHGKGQAVLADGFELGPTFARLKVRPRDDTDFSRVKRQADNLKLHLVLEEKPIIASQAGYISIDVQRPDRQTVPVAPLLASRPAALAGQPAFPVGVDVSGKAHWLNFSSADTCHLLLAGTTGSGKSELLKVILAGLAHHLSPAQLQIFLIDPKQVTFNLSGATPYLPRPVVHDITQALPLIEECYKEMERRYTLLRRRGKEHVAELTGSDAVPRWLVIFDEFADLMADRSNKKDMEALLSRLGAKARASGVHLVLGTQRPEASVVTPLLRSNLPGRISLRVLSERDSRIILPEQPDAAYLLGKGDLLWYHGAGLTRLQCPFVTRQELEALLRLH